MPTPPRRNLRRIRRPLLALVVLVVVLAIGYGVRACDSDHGRTNGAPHAVLHSGAERVGTPRR